MKKPVCAAGAKKCFLEEAKNRQLQKQLVNHKNIEGIIIPNNTCSGQILQKSALASESRDNTTSFAAEVPLSDQAVDTQLLKDYRYFSNTPLENEVLLNNNQIIRKQPHGMMEEQGNTPSKFQFSQSGLLYTLNMIREPVVEYQEARGVPRNEEITFLTLVTSLCTQAYTAAITILVMLWNLMPLVDGFVYFVRFLLDKVIDIVQTDDNKDRAIKAAILFAELTIITFIIFLIVGLIFMPVYVLMARLFGKIFSMVAW